MIRLIPFVLYILLITLHEVALRDLITLYSTQISLAPLLVVLVALYKSELTAAWFGFIVGLVVSVGSTAILGWHALLLAAMGVVAYHVRQRLNVESLYSRLLLVLGVVLLHNLTWLLINRTEAFWPFVLSYGLGSAVYTTFAAWLFFLIKDGRPTLARMKSIF